MRKKANFCSVPYECVPAGNIPYREIIEYDYKKHKTNKYLFTQGEPIDPSQITSPEGSEQTIAYEDLIIDAETTMEAIRQYHWVANTFLSPIVSPALHEFMERECGEDFETFPCEIHATDGIIQEYKLLNITKLVDCIDRERSTEWNEVIGGKKTFFGYRNVHLYADCTQCMGDARLARLKEDNTIILMERSLGDLIRKEKLYKGLKLREMPH